MLINDTVRAFNSPPGTDEEEEPPRASGMRNETSMSCQLIEEVPHPSTPDVKKLP